MSESKFKAKAKTPPACRWILLISVTIGGYITVSANPTLSHIFPDHVVLQRGLEIPVWGSADAGEKINVTLGADVRETIAGPDGRWKVSLPARDAGGPFRLAVVGKSTLVIKDVMIGEVWVASGQTNHGECEVASVVLKNSQPSPLFSFTCETALMMVAHG